MPTRTPPCTHRPHRDTYMVTEDAANWTEISPNFSIPTAAAALSLDLSLCAHSALPHVYTELLETKCSQTVASAVGAWLEFIDWIFVGSWNLIGIQVQTDWNFVFWLVSNWNPITD